MFVTRSGKPSRRHLEWRIRVFGMGAILALSQLFRTTKIVNPAPPESFSTSTGD